MSQSWLLAFVIVVSIQLFPVSQNQLMIASKIIAGSDIDQCPLQEHSRNAAIEEIRNSVLDTVLQLQHQNECGDGLWYCVTKLNMSNPSQQCPSAWREFVSDGVRTCTRPITTSGNCPGTSYSISRRYSKVCGRVIGYQFGSPSAFELGAVEGRTIDEAYVEGVSITHGRNPLKHIWSYAAGSSEHRNSQECSDSKCPCNGGREPPSYVENNYYCESAYKGLTGCFVTNRFFPNDPLWDGQQCDNDEGTCCDSNGTNTPPWFSVDLPDSTSDDIEVRICHDQDTTDEDTPLQLLELYVQ